MWTRKELKDKAKVSFKANYWKTVFVALVLMLVIGGMSLFSSMQSVPMAAMPSMATSSTPDNVNVEIRDGKVKVDVNFVVEYGSPVPEVAKNIQENVKKAIETMSGLTVEVIDVHVQGISFERENKAVAEIEQQQRLLLQKQENERKAEEEAAAPAEKPQPVKEEPAQPEEAEAADDEAPSAEENEDEAAQE